MKGYCKLAFFGVLVGAAVLNLLICFTNSVSGEYAVTEDGAVKTSLIRAARGILREIEYNEYDEALDRLYGESAALTEYIEANKRLTRGRESLPYLQRYTRDEAEEIAGRYDLTEKEAQGRLEVLGYCIGRLEYSLEYGDYLARLNMNAAQMSQVSIFDGSVARGAAKARADFYGLESLRISAEPEEGFTAAVGGGVCDLLALMAAAVCGVLYALGTREFAGKGNNGARGAGFGAAFIIGICCIYGGNILAADRLIGIGDLSRAVQSVSAFRSCCYPLSAGTFLGLGIICRAAVCLTVYLISAGIMGMESKGKRVFAGVVFFISAAFLGAGYFTSNDSGAGYPYKIIGVYRQANIFGEAVNPAGLLFLGICVGVTVSGIFAAGQLKKARDTALRQAEVDHYNRINERWAEARQIRHDIGNHMAAVSALLDKGDIEGARKYLGEAENELLGAPLPAKTGSAVLDMLIATKESEMKKEGVMLLTEFSADLSGGGISDFDLCVIFGNLLDNACEAAAKLSSEDRVVRLTVKRQMDMVMIYCENKFEGERPAKSGFATVKKDKVLHGNGLRGIRRAAEKYGGHLNVSDDNGVFSAAVIVRG
ncbi:MAG: ATP-binding protein [Oscillospiraceae bacterium]|nr:ATP-binding protein [Oscillospiraceae bacterium]